MNESKIQNRESKMLAGVALLLAYPAAARAQMALFMTQQPLSCTVPISTYATASGKPLAFIENWGKGWGPSSANNPVNNGCGSPSSSNCQVHWVGSGYGTFAVAAPSGTTPANAACTNTLQVTAASGEASYIYTSDIPEFLYNASGSQAYDAYFPINWITNGVPSGDLDTAVGLGALGPPAEGGEAISFRLNNYLGTTARFEVYGGTTGTASSGTPTITLGSWYLVHLHRDATNTNCNWYLSSNNGSTWTTEGSFTCGTENTNYVEIGDDTGNHGTEVYQIPWIAIYGGTGVWNFQNPLSVLNASAGTAGNAPATADLESETWGSGWKHTVTVNTASSDAITYVSASGVSPSVPSLYRPVQALGTLFTQDSMLFAYNNCMTPTRQAACGGTGSSNPNESIAFTVPIPSGATAYTGSWGVLEMIDTGGDTTDHFSPFILSNTGGSYCADHYYAGNSPGPAMWITDSSGSAYIPISEGHWYWWTCQLVTTSTGTPTAYLAGFDMQTSPPTNLACQQSVAGTNSTWCVTYNGVSAIEWTGGSGTGLLNDFSTYRQGLDTGSSGTTTVQNTYWGIYVQDMLKGCFPLGPIKWSCN